MTRPSTSNANPLCALCMPPTKKEEFPTQATTSSTINCFRFHKKGHVAAQCPTRGILLEVDKEEGDCTLEKAILLEGNVEDEIYKGTLTYLGMSINSSDNPLK